MQDLIEERILIVAWNTGIYGNDCNKNLHFHIKKYFKPSIFRRIIYRNIISNEAFIWDYSISLYASHLLKDSLNDEAILCEEIFEAVFRKLTKWIGGDFQLINWKWAIAEYYPEAKYEEAPGLATDSEQSILFMRIKEYYSKLDMKSDLNEEAIQNSIKLLVERLLTKYIQKGQTIDELYLWQANGISEFSSYLDIYAKGLIDEVNSILMEPDEEAIINRAIQISTFKPIKELIEVDLYFKKHTKTYQKLRP